MYYGDDCDEVIVDPACNDCVLNPELAGMRKVAKIHQSYYPTLAANPTSYAVWLAGIQAGKIKITPGLRGDFDGGTPVMGPGYGDRLETYLGSKYKGTVYDPNYIDNAAHYQSILKTANWHIAYQTQTQGHLSAKPVTFSPGNPVDDDITKQMEWKVDFTFFQPDLVLPFTMPAGIMDCAWAE